MAIQSITRANAWHGLPRPSWRHGMARTANESISPGLWKGLIGAWCASLGPTGTTIRDASGNGFDGVLSGAITASDLWQTDGGLAGWAFRFPASPTGYIDVNPGLIPIDKTYSLWARNSSGAITYGVIIEGGSDTPNFQHGDNGDELQWWGSPSFTSSRFMVVGDWWQITVTSDVSGSICYVNGWVDVTGARTDGTATRVGIGGGLGGAPNDQFEGWMDDVRIYDRALSAAEVRESYALGPGGIFIPVRQRAYFIPPAPGGLSIPVAMASYRRRREMRM